MGADMRRQILIEGPNVHDQFFICDSDMNIWDGSEWRGFGRPAGFSTFRDALTVAGKLRDGAQI